MSGLDVSPAVRVILDAQKKRSLTAKAKDAYIASLEAKVEKLRSALFGFLQVGPDELDGFEIAVRSLTPRDTENVAIALAAIQALRETQGGA